MRTFTRRHGDTPLRVTCRWCSAPQGTHCVVRGKNDILRDAQGHFVFHPAREDDYYKEHVAMKMPPPPAGKKWSWTQSICEDCWKVHGVGEPHRISQEGRETMREQGLLREQCSFCGQGHESAIYTRRSPAEVPYPRLEWIEV